MFLFKNLSPLHRMLFGIGISNIFLFVLLLLFSYLFELTEFHFILMSVFAASFNFIWARFLIKRTFTTVEKAAANLKQTVDEDKAIALDTSKLKDLGHQKEVKDLVDAFNHLVDDIHAKAKESNRILQTYSRDKNGDS